jgi:DNA segregation ATPase FtsK/SpoIIIE, S-DNA-T family
VATKTKKRSGGRGRGTSGKDSGTSRRSTSKSKKSAKSGSSGTKASGKSSGTSGGVGQTVRSHLGEQIRDVYGVGLLLLAVLAALGIYGGRAGAVGATLAAVSRGVFGLAGYVVPLLVAYVGVLLVGDRPVEERGRRAIGLTLLVLAAVGALHLAGGTPHPGEGVRELWTAGGLLGWALVHPLLLAVGTWGAIAVVAAVAFLGLLIFTKTPLSHVWHAIVRTVRFLVGLLTGATSIDEEAADAADDAAEKPAAGDEEPPARAVLALDGEATESGRAPTAPKPDVKEEPTGPRKARRVKPPDASFAGYELPPLDLLRLGKAAGTSAIQRQLDAQATALQETFEQFGVDATVARTTRGPTVTRFEVELGAGVQVRRVVGLADDISYALAAPDVRIVAPIPGKSAIGVEVPNRERDLITLRDVLESEVGAADDHPLTVALGVDIAGRPALVNLTTMPHLLISGATGAGKSVTLNGMIASVLLRARPDQVRMILVDPKRVELNHYEGAPHLLSPVITDPKKAASALEWVVKEMENRYETLAMLGFRNLDSYNAAVRDGEIPMSAATLLAEGGAAAVVAEAAGDEDAESPFKHLPYILVVIDELADLMLVAPRDVEDAICRIAQMARAVGIHLLIATQRPSVDVITGLIKANIPSRLALATASQTDSRTILDQVGAEKLVGDGDMLFLPSSQGKPSRLQGAYVSEGEIDSVVEFCRRQRDPDFIDGVARTGTDPSEIDLAEVSADDDDEILMMKAMDLVVRSGLGSTSMLQRKLRIGFARAGRLMDELEERGVVGPSEGSKAREVLTTVEELEEMQESSGMAR